MEELQSATLIHSSHRPVVTDEPTELGLDTMSV